MIDLLRDVRVFEDEIIRIRRRIREHPELSFKEFETARLVAQKLRTMDTARHPMKQSTRYSSQPN